MRLTPIACAAFLVTGFALAAHALDVPTAPPAPPAHPSAPLAPPPPPPPPDMALGLGGRALHELDLTTEQRRQVRSLVRGSMDDGLGEALEAVHTARQALERALWDPSADEARLSALRHDAAQAEDRLLGARRQLAREVVQLLTEDQRTELLQLLDETPRWGPPRR